MTFYTTLVSLTQIAVRLEKTVTSSLNDTSTNSTSNNLEMRALSAVMGQVVTDACNYVSIVLHEDFMLLLSISVMVCSLCRSCGIMCVSIPDV